MKLEEKNEALKLIKQFVEFANKLSWTDKEIFLSMLKDKICIHCGREITDNRHCVCTWDY